jgi:hypothetical protein
MVKKTRLQRPTLWIASPIVFFLLLACIGSGGAQTLPVGTEAPDFEVRADEQPVTLRDLRGEVVLVNFWSST